MQFLSESHHERYEQNAGPLGVATTLSVPFRQARRDGCEVFGIVGCQRKVQRRTTDEHQEDGFPFQSNRPLTYLPAVLLQGVGLRAQEKLPLSKPSGPRCCRDPFKSFSNSVLAFSNLTDNDGKPTCYGIIGCAGGRGSKCVEGKWPACSPRSLGPCVKSLPISPCLGTPFLLLVAGEGIAAVKQLSVTIRTEALPRALRFLTDRRPPPGTTLSARPLHLA